MGQGSRLIRPRTVTGDGGGLVSHAGVAWLAETADLSGLSAGLRAASTLRGGLRAGFRSAWPETPRRRPVYRRLESGHAP